MTPLTVCQPLILAASFRENSPGGLNQAKDGVVVAQVVLGEGKPFLGFMRGLHSPSLRLNKIRYGSLSRGGFEPAYEGIAPLQESEPKSVGVKPTPASGWFQRTDCALPPKLRGQNLIEEKGHLVHGVPA